MSVNRFQFSGNLTRDAEVRESGRSTTIATLTLAVDRKWRDSSENLQEKTDFFRIKVFGVIAESAGKYLGKGSKVFVEGRVEPTQYDRDGETIYGMDFIAGMIDYLDTKPPSGQQTSD
ncbi:single-stranded DNA-binding protein [Pandoraea apista]|uniref:single-stranded DNA-binding protein n=1 Tax=Pandoraea apista TaxID=93218 RepID=UPI00065A0437|nr:single-stranded DNA-binding protein [Pandoraea apista]ALS68403.1 single-stranded DNA-binding protein [Pandoraea apista]CFB60425.1 Single-stranded DNA-binding protein [Pandoraea apista]